MAGRFMSGLLFNSGRSLCFGVGEVVCILSTVFGGALVLRRVVRDCAPLVVVWLMGASSMS